MKTFLAFLCLLFLIEIALGHMAVWTRSMWGSEPSNQNSNHAALPLQEYNFSRWWMHGDLNDPPPANQITQIPAGGVVDFELASNKAWTSMGRSGKLWAKEGTSPREIPNPWSNDLGGVANIHAPKREHVAGCAIGIAYKSNVRDVKPEDFVIVSVVRDCIARQLQAFDFPALPGCPNGKCICSWFWIHASAGGTDQMYMTPFQCNITNPTNYVIAKPSAPRRCDGDPACTGNPNWDKNNRTTVCAKSLNPMYWKNLEGNNIYNPAHCAPHYNSSYGYPDGAQNQIFTNMPAAPSGAIGDTVKVGGSISSSPSAWLLSPCRRTRVVVQGDGNIVMYNMTSGRVHWASNTQKQGTGPYKLVVQGDGNVVLRDTTGAAIWNTRTNGKGVGPYQLKLREPRSFSVVDRDGTTLWSAPTYD